MVRNNVAPFNRDNPIVVNVSSNTEKPDFLHEPGRIDGHPPKVTIIVKVKDYSGVKIVKLYYKELPSFLKWKSVKMSLNGNGDYEDGILLNSHGLTYRFEGIDIHNNATIYPNPDVQTPYFVIDSWGE